MMSSITSRGQLAFMVFEDRFSSKVMMRFLRRLLKHTRRKMFLIVDHHPVHRSGELERRLVRQSDCIRMFLLPSYSPELNPDELVNQDVKTNAVGRQRPHNPKEMIGQVRAYLRSTRHRPDIVTSHFREEHVVYAAA